MRSPPSSRQRWRGCPTREDERLRDAVVLTDYAVAARYPGEREPVGRDDAEAACRLAAQVVSWAERVVGQRAEGGTD